MLNIFATTALDSTFAAYVDAIAMTNALNSTTINATRCTAKMSVEGGNAAVTSHHC